MILFKAEKQELINQINQNSSKSSTIDKCIIDLTAGANSNNISEPMNATFSYNSFNKGRIIHNYSFSDKKVKSPLARQPSDCDMKHYSLNEPAKTNYNNFIKPISNLNKTYSLLNEKQHRSAPI